MTGEQCPCCRLPRFFAYTGDLYLVQRYLSRSVEPSDLGGPLPTRVDDQYSGISS